MGEFEAEIAGWRPEQLIVRVDRTDPAKNLIRGFLAYERLLEDHPEYHGRVALWAFLQPSRQDVEAYQQYLVLVRSTVDRINSRFRKGAWEPTRLDLGEVLHIASHLEEALSVLEEAQSLYVQKGNLASARTTRFPSPVMR